MLHEVADRTRDPVNAIVIAFVESQREFLMVVSTTHFSHFSAPVSTPSQQVQTFFKQDRLKTSRSTLA